MRAPSTTRDRRRHLRVSAVALPVLLALAIDADARPSAEVAAPRSRAIAMVSDAAGVDATRLRIVETSASAWEGSARRLTSYKVVSRDGRLFGISFDSATGDVVDPDASARDAWRDARRDAGTIDPALASSMARAASDALPVAIWTTMADPGALGRTDAGLGELAERARASQSPVLARIRDLVPDVAAARMAPADLVPVVFARLTAGQIEGLSHHPGVAAIYEVPDDAAELSDDIATSDRYTFVWPTVTGEGSAVAIHESGGVDDVNPFLNAGREVLYWSDTQPWIGGHWVSKHATNVAGVMASTHPWRRGGAFGISRILSADFQTFADPEFGVQSVGAATWAIENGADTINMSWGACSGGAQTFHSRWVDYLVKATGTNVVVSAGNGTCGGGGANVVMWPSLGWNTISVGSYSDNDTGLRTDDKLSAFGGRPGSFVNPTDPLSGRTYEKPDVLGMGGRSCTGVGTTGVGGGVGDSTCGTSFSAPGVSALTALIEERLGEAAAPELTKAIIMASATHNIVDGMNLRSCPSSPIPNDCRDGAGAIDAYQAITNVIAPGHWAFPGLVTPESFAPGPMEFSASFDANRDARIAIAWDSSASCTNPGTLEAVCDADVLNADLDLVVLDPAGTVVATSASFQDSTEVIDFRPPVTGAYRIQVHAHRFDEGTNTFLGVAWNGDVTDRLTPLTRETVLPLGTKMTGQTTDMGTSFWDKYSGTPSSCVTFAKQETGLERIYRVTTTRSGRLTASLTDVVASPDVDDDIDVIVLKRSGAANAQNGKMIACGETQATTPTVAAGTYYVVVDGDQGSVATYDITATFAPS